jgi:hypothetical protein
MRSMGGTDGLEKLAKEKAACAAAFRDFGRPTGMDPARARFRGRKAAPFRRRPAHSLPDAAKSLTWDHLLSVVET